MKKLFAVIAILTLSIFLVSCGGGSSSSGVSVNLTGSWSGSWRSSIGQSGALTGSFTQSGATFNGPVTIYNSNCFGYEYATGTLSGSNVQIGISSSAIIFNGSVSGSTISGTYYVYTTACSGDAGTFVLRK
jgi:hypothetical protein